MFGVFKRLFIGFLIRSSGTWVGSPADNRSDDQKKEDRSDDQKKDNRSDDQKKEDRSDDQKKEDAKQES